MRGKLKFFKIFQKFTGVLQEIGAMCRNSLAWGMHFTEMKVSAVDLFKATASSEQGQIFMPYLGGRLVGCRV